MNAASNSYNIHDKKPFFASHCEGTSSLTLHIPEFSMHECSELMIRPIESIIPDRILKAFDDNIVIVPDAVY